MSVIAVIRDPSKIRVGSLFTTPGRRGEGEEIQEKEVGICGYRQILVCLWN
jgi:hypothetical protein